MTPRDIRIIVAAVVWAQCYRGHWPRTHMYEKPEAGEGQVSAKRLREAELALLAAVEER